MQLTLPFVFEEQPHPQNIPQPELARLLLGSWSGGERYIYKNQRLMAASIWFHFFTGGKATISIRSKDEPNLKIASGRWQLKEQELELMLGRSRIRSRALLHQGLLHWAGEILIRLPSGLTPPLQTLKQKKSLTMRRLA
jgi:hypothetical protein